MKSLELFRQRARGIDAVVIARSGQIGRIRFMGALLGRGMAADLREAGPRPTTSRLSVQHGDRTQQSVKVHKFSTRIRLE